MTLLQNVADGNESRNVSVVTAVDVDVENTMLHHHSTSYGEHYWTLDLSGCGSGLSRHLHLFSWGHFPTLQGK